jgi:two-component system nitrogen regulation sensor histidine kinase GlnL
MKGRLLIIDDEETLCYFLKESLEEKGYHAVAVHTAREGLEQAAKQDADLVLLDLKLPDGEGLDVLREIRNYNADLPVIVLTGHAAVESAVRAMKLGAYDYLEKPINLAQLSSSVAEVLNSSPTKRAQVKVVDDEAEAARTAGQEQEASVEATTQAGITLEQSAALSRRLRQLERRLQEASVLDSIWRDLVQHGTVQQLTESVADDLLQLGSVDMVAIFVGDGQEEDLVLASQRRFPGEVWEDPQLRRIPLDGVLGQEVARWDTAQPLSEAGPDPWVEEVDARLGDGIVGVLVPLCDGQLLWGLMLVGRRSGRPHDEGEAAILCMVGRRLALALSRASHLSSLRDRTGWLAEREARQRLLLESMADGVVVVDGHGSVVLANPAAERLLGCVEEEALGRQIEDLLGTGAAVVHDSLRRHLSYCQEEISVGELGEERIALQIGVSPVRGDGGSKSGAVITLTDLSRAKEQEEERSKRDRLTVLAEVSGVVAHEIRNPLAGMVAGIQHLLTKSREGDERHEALQRMLKEGERVNRIIEDILLITRPPHLDLAPCDVSDVVAEVLEQNEDNARALGVQVRLYRSPGLPLVSGDQERLHRALATVVSNGIESMPEGGRLDVVITGPAREGANYVEVEIADNGVGIKRDEIDRVFEPFYSTKTRGTGLGLVIAKRIIDGHGGEIEIQSEEGEGTKVLVRLPLAGRGGE